MAIAEWATGLYYIAFFAIIMQSNTFYNTVHEEEDLNQVMPSEHNQI